MNPSWALLSLAILTACSVPDRRPAAPPFTSAVHEASAGPGEARPEEHQVLDLALSAYFSHVSTQQSPPAFQVIQHGEIVIMLGRHGLPEGYAPSLPSLYRIVLVGNSEGVGDPEQVAKLGHESGASTPKVYYARMRRTAPDEAVVYFARKLPSEGSWGGGGGLVSLSRVGGNWLVKAFGGWIV